MRPPSVSERTTALQRFVPRIAADWDLTAPGRMWQEVDGSLCFVDISGFTSLSERLARQGRIGAEELTDVLNRVFGHMLGSAYAYGGSLLKFGGDALTLLFTGEGHAEATASAAVQMQTALRLASTVPTTVGKVPLRMSVGIHSGTIHLFCIGSSHRELVVTGPAGTMTTLMEQTAEAGEILVSSATRDALPPAAAPRAKGEGWLLKWRKPLIAPGDLDRRAFRSDHPVDRWVPSALRTYLTAARPEPEHRVTTVGFVRFCGVDEVMNQRGPSAVAESLHETMSAIQDAADADGVSFLATDINEDGGKVLLVAGVPASHEDDEGRMLRTARRIADASTPLELHIGVNRGHVYAGEVGTDYRSTYTVMGDTVNVAARLCSAAWADKIYATPDVLDRSHTLFASQSLDPLSVKGKSEPLVVYSVGDELGLRTVDTRTDMPFVGRTAELAALEELIAAIGDGTATVATIVGEAGVGKSRLMEGTLHDQSELERFEIRGEPYGTANPYRPFRDPVRRLLGVERGSHKEMARTLTRRVKALDAQLVPLVPLLGDVVHVEIADTPEVASIEPRFRRDRLADALIRVFDLALPGRTAFVVEDAQWIDEASAHLMGRVASATPDSPWLVVATRRGGSDGYTPETGPVIQLAPLSADEAERLVIEATAAAPMRPHEIDAVVARAGGNPLFLEETMRMVRETGSTAALPDSLGAVVGTRIDALPPLASRILRYASVLGRSFRLETLRAVLSEERLDLDAATRKTLAGFLEPDGSGRFRFRHALARDVAYDGLSFRRRRELHLRAAAVAERQAGDALEDVADLLATHYTLGADHAKAWRFARMAGDHAKETYANVEAGINYERALESARRLGNVAPADRAAVWIDLGDVRGPIGLFDDALDAYRRASRMLGDDKLAKADTQYKRALMRERAGAYPMALREISTGYKLVEDVDSKEAAQTRARLTARRAFIRQAQERPAEALEMAELAAAQALKAGEQHAEAQACMVMHWAHLMLGIPEGAQYGERAVEIFRTLDELESLAGALNLLGADAYFAGKWDEAVRFYRQGQEAATKAGDVIHTALFGSNVGEVLVNQGRLDEAEPILREAIRVQRGSGWEEGADAAEGYLGALLVQRGDLEEAETLLRSVRNDYLTKGRRGVAGGIGISLAQCLVRRGRLKDAAVLLDEIEAGGGDFVIQAPFLALVRSELLAASGLETEALEIAKTGIAVAVAQGLDYERALLILAVASLGRRTGQPPSADDEAIAASILERLGVQRSVGSSPAFA